MKKLSTRMNDWSALMVVAILVIAAPQTIGQGVDPDIKEKQEAYCSAVYKRKRI